MFEVIKTIAIEVTTPRGLGLGEVEAIERRADATKRQQLKKQGHRGHTSTVDQGGPVVWGLPAGAPHRWIRWGQPPDLKVQETSSAWCSLMA